MHEVATRQLMELIEVGHNRSSIDQAQLLLAWGYPEKEWSELAHVPIGQRDAMLLMLRAKWFGSDIRLGCRCPKCNASFEFETSVEELCSVIPDEADCQNSCIVSRYGKEYEIRPINGRDLAGLPRDCPKDVAVRFLARQTILSVRNSSGDALPIPDPDKLKDALLLQIGNALEKQDPLSVIAFPVACADCGHDWEALFEPVRLLWDELGNENDALLEDIHLLAKEYGWRENDILSISARRRRVYAQRLLEQANG